MMAPGTGSKEISVGYAQFGPRDRGVTMLNKLSKIALAMALAFAVCGVGLRPALADAHHHGGGHGDRSEQHGGGHGRWHQARSYSAPQPNYYYAPQPNYYYAPEPDQYSYQQRYYSPGPSQGVNMFFGLF